MSLDTGDKNSVLFRGLSGFWQKFFKDAKDIEAYYQASEIYLGQVYLDLLSSILNIGIVDTPVFNREYWKLFTIKETELNFSAGATATDSRYLYDMPAETASVDFLQNAILEPSIVLEREVNFEVLDNDGLARFFDDPFSAVKDSDGNYTPTPGTAWRTVRTAVGNKMYDTGLSLYFSASFKSSNYYDRGVYRGDTLRILAYRGSLLREGLAGYIQNVSPLTIFHGTGVGLCKVGDVIQVYNHAGSTPDANDIWKGFYIVKTVNVLLPNQVILEPLTVGTTTSSSTVNLHWKQYSSIYFEVNGASTPTRPLLPPWVATTVYVVGNIVQSADGDRYYCSVAGTSGSTEPTWDSTIGNTTTDNTVTWIREANASIPAAQALQPFRDYEVDYYEGMQLVGSLDNPYPLDLEGPVVAAVVRDSPDPDVYGAALNYLGMSPAPIPPVVPFPQGSPGTVTDLGTRYVIPGSVAIQAYKWRMDSVIKLVPVEEGVDYTIDYVRGLIRQLKYWDDSSLGRCDYQYQTEVALSGAMTIEEYAVGNVRQLSYWVPEVMVDRFNLWYNYGSLLNRFDASSEAYKAFLMGIMYLYMSGPILQRIESALNVAAEYPVVRQEGEVLVSYDDGIISSGSSGAIDGTSATVTIPTSEYVLSSLDIGGYVIFPNPLNAANKDKFQITEVNTTLNSAILVSRYGLVTESPVDWILSHSYQKTIITDSNTYLFPFYVPIRTDIQDVLNRNVLTFEAFESLTTAFTVTDYLEDPMWWKDKVIPPVLWDSTTARRRSTTLLFANVIGAIDEPVIGDPGLYIGADEEGNVLTPADSRPLDISSIVWQSGNTIRYTFNDNPDLSEVAAATAAVTLIVTLSTNVINNGSFVVTDVDMVNSWVEVTNVGRNNSTADEYSSPAEATVTGAIIPVPIYRHNVAFIIFDKYLKAHMYYIEMSVDLELDDQFRQDLEELVLVAKPSYTYPTVEPNEMFIDNVGLVDVFELPLITLLFGGDGSDSLHLANNELIIGDTEFPWNIGDFFRYVSTPVLYTGIVNPILAGAVYTPTFAGTPGMYLVTLNGVTRDSDGEPAIEGRDYTVDWLIEKPAGTLNPLRWSVTFLTDCNVPVTTLTIDYESIERLNGSYDTTLGWTPVTIGACNPWYVRAAALDPTSPTYLTELAALVPEYVDRPLQLTINDGGSYTYP